MKNSAYHFKISIFAFSLIMGISLSTNTKQKVQLLKKTTAPVNYYSELKNESEKLLNAIEKNNHEQLINLVEKENVSITSIDQQQPLIAQAVDAFIKRKNDDLFIFLYLLANGASFSDADVQGIETLIYFDDPELNDAWSIVLKYLIEFKEAKTKDGKNKLLKKIISASKPFLPEQIQKKLLDKTDEAYSTQIFFPTTPKSIDAELLDWVFVPSKEEEKNKFKKLFEDDENDSEEWEWVE